MNLEQLRRYRQQGAADVSSAGHFPGSSAGKMPAARSGSRKAHFALVHRLLNRNNFWRQ
jgi:hypothetical protein